MAPRFGKRTEQLTPWRQQSFILCRDSSSAAARSLLPSLFHHPQKPRDPESADCSETVFPFADLSEFTAADLSDSTEAAARRADGGAAFTDGEIAARNRSLEGRDLSGVQASWLGGGDSGSA